jgi:carbonic anhydrase
VVEGQHPLAAVLGCADSRVPVELLFTDRLRAGQLKVVAGYYDLHSSAIDWMGQVEPIRYPGPS